MTTATETKTTRKAAATLTTLTALDKLGLASNFRFTELPLWSRGRVDN